MSGRRVKNRFVERWCFYCDPERGRSEWFCQMEIKEPTHPPKLTIVARRKQPKRDKRRYRRIRGKR